MRPRKIVFAAKVMGGNIKRIRKARGLRVKSLADAMGVVVQSWYKWERGDVLPGEYHQIRIAECLRVDLEVLRRGWSESAGEDDNRPERANGSSRAGAMSGAPDMPVTGMAACGRGGWYARKSVGLRAPAERDYEHPGRLFAVLAVGCDMEPDGIRAGYLLYCDEELEPESGDAVFVVMKDGTAAVKHFVRRDEHFIVFRDWLTDGGPGPWPESVYTIGVESLQSIACVVVVRRK